MIKCAACETENPDGSALCQNCGKAVGPSSEGSVPARRRNLTPLLVTAAVVLRAIVAGGIWMVRKGAEASESTPPKLPDPVIAEPQPQAVQSQLGDIYYPGAKTQPSIMEQGANTLINLETADPVIKVRDYYKSKLENINLLMDETDRFSLSFYKDDNKKGLISATEQDGHTVITIAVGPTALALPPSKSAKSG